MKVILIAPGFPAEMPLFTRGLHEVGAKVLGVGDGPAATLPKEARESLADYLQVRDLWDEEAVCKEVHQWVRGQEIDRVECLWEPGMVLAARLREHLGVPGLTVEQTIPFRDKEKMKQVLDAAGVRTPRHASARTKDEVRAAAERIGYPLIVKPIAGAGSADTYPVRDGGELEEVLGLLGHIEEVSVEEYIEGEEYTFDTVCANGKVLFHNVSWYRPKPLLARLNQWISAQAILLRNTEADEPRSGVELGYHVLEALGFQSGFTHMEWFRTPSGEAVFGEIGARPPGGRLVHAMNFSCDIDLFKGWAEAVCYGTLSQDTRKKYNTALIFKRAQGEGKIERIEGLESLMARFGEHIVCVDLLPVGTPRRDWKKIVIGDGWVVARHPDLATTLEIADHLSTDLRMFAGSGA